MKNVASFALARCLRRSPLRMAKRRRPIRIPR
jgi:hypothetical protein